MTTHNPGNLGQMKTGHIRHYQRPRNNQSGGGLFAPIVLGFLVFVCFTGLLMSILNPTDIPGVVADLDAKGTKVKAEMGQDRALPFSPQSGPRPSI